MINKNPLSGTQGIDDFSLKFLHMRRNKSPASPVLRPKGWGIKPTPENNYIGYRLMESWGIINVFMRKYMLFLLLFSAQCFSCFAEDKYFNQRLLETEGNNRTSLKEGVIFDKAHLGNLIVYGSVVLFNTTISQHYIDYKNFNILLVTEKTNNIEYVMDYLIIEKQNIETHLASGAVEINNDYFDWELTIVVNHKWKGRFTTDILQAYKINMETKKIEPFIYESIKLYSEV